MPDDETLIGYVRKATALKDSGVTKPKRTEPKKKERAELEVPDYFAAALRNNKKAQQTFENFSYSHRKEYLEWVTEAKRDETRENRLATAIEWLAEGKPRNWKYQRA